MSDSQSSHILLSQDRDTIDSNSTTEIISNYSSIVKTTGNAAYYIITSSIARKLIFTGTMYLAGGTIISTVGLPTVLLAGTLILLS